MASGRTVTFGAVGDIALHDRVGEDCLRHGPDWPFEKMKPELSRADLLFGSMESVFIPPRYPRKRIDPAGLVSPVPGREAAAALRRAGFHFLNLAANHVLDAGCVGLDYTRECLQHAGILTGGVGYSQTAARRLKVIRRNGIRFGFLCYCEDNNYTLGHTSPGPAYYRLDNVLADVKKHRRAVDVLVVSIHADMEFMPTPSVPRLLNSRAIARAGADIILEHHPHVPQGVERVGRSLVAYSLGNFVFDAHTMEYLKSNGPHTAHSFLLLMEVGKSGVRSFERVPFAISPPPEQRPAPLAGARRTRMSAYLRRLDGYLADDDFVRKTWQEVARRHLAIYIKRAAERDVDGVIEELVGRLCLTAENRSWMEEILAMGRDAWAAQQKIDDPLHRPHYRFTRHRVK